MAGTGSLLPVALPASSLHHHRAPAPRNKDPRPNQEKNPNIFEGIPRQDEMTTTFITLPTTQAAQLIPQSGGFPYYAPLSLPNTVHLMTVTSLEESPWFFERHLDNADGLHREQRRHHTDLPLVSLSSSRRRSNRWMPSSTSNFREGKFLLHSHSREVTLDDENGSVDKVVDHNFGIDSPSFSHHLELDINKEDCDSVTDELNDVERKSLSCSSKPHNTASLELFGIPIQSIILLNLVAVIWGTQHAVIKTVVGGGVGDGTDSTAAYFTLARFGLAAALAAPYTPGWGQRELQQQNLAVEQSTDGKNVNYVPTDESNEDSIINTTSAGRLAWKYGAELGLYMFLGYAFQAIGLETTTASRSGFLLYLNVKFVPFLSYLIFGRTIRRGTWISALVAFCGTALLALDVGAEETTTSASTITAALSVGDLWSIAAAASSAMFILRVESASKAIPKSSELNAATLWIVALLSLLWTMVVSLSESSDGGSVGGEGGIQINNASVVHAIQLLSQRTYSTISTHLLPLIYLSGVTTALANYLQSKAQKDISAERASVIYAMDPVYGAIFANVLLGETLGGVGLVGAFLIVVAAAANASVDFTGGGGWEKAKESDQHDDS